MTKSLFEQIENSIDYQSPQFLQAVIVTILCPLIWNTVARFLHYITSSVKPNTSKSTRYALCYAMTVWIFLFSTYRDYLIHQLMSAQAKSALLEQYSYILHPLAFVLIGLGQLFVWGSFWKLGITGTFLGDYVGILMDARVTGFPFNVLENPMYVGATMSFLGTSLWNNSPVGLAMTAVVFLVYQVALMFEGPYTTMIYENRAKKQQKSK